MKLKECLQHIKENIETISVAEVTKHVTTFGAKLINRSFNYNKAKKEDYPLLLSQGPSMNLLCWALLHQRNDLAQVFLTADDVDVSSVPNSYYSTSNRYAGGAFWFALCNQAYDLCSTMLEFEFTLHPYFIRRKNNIKVPYPVALPIIQKLEDLLTENKDDPELHAETVELVKELFAYAVDKHRFEGNPQEIIALLDHLAGCQALQILTIVANILEQDHVEHLLLSAVATENIKSKLIRFIVEECQLVDLDQAGYISNSGEILNRSNLITVLLKQHRAEKSMRTRVNIFAAMQILLANGADLLETYDCIGAHDSINALRELEELSPILNIRISEADYFLLYLCNTHPCKQYMTNECKFLVASYVLNKHDRHFVERNIATFYQNFIAPKTCNWGMLLPLLLNMHDLSFMQEFWDKEDRSGKCILDYLSMQHMHAGSGEYIFRERTARFLYLAAKAGAWIDLQQAAEFVNMQRKEITQAVLNGGIFFQGRRTLLKYLSNNQQFDAALAIFEEGDYSTFTDDEKTILQQRLPAIARYGHVKTFKKTYAPGLDVSIFDSSGASARRLALDFEQKEIINWIAAHDHIPETEANSLRTDAINRNRLHLLDDGKYTRSAAYYYAQANTAIEDPRLTLTNFAFAIGGIDPNDAPQHDMLCSLLIRLSLKEIQDVISISIRKKFYQSLRNILRGLIHLIDIYNAQREHTISIDDTEIDRDKLARILERCPILHFEPEDIFMISPRDSSVDFFTMLITAIAACDPHACRIIITHFPSAMDRAPSHRAPNYRNYFDKAIIAYMQPALYSEAKHNNLREIIYMLLSHGARPCAFAGTDTFEIICAEYKLSVRTKLLAVDTLRFHTPAPIPHAIWRDKILPFAGLETDPQRCGAVENKVLQQWRSKLGM